MDQLFAPWRIEWVEREDRNEGFDGCVFCELPAREDAVEHHVVAETDEAYVLLNNYPYSPGHAMVIPRVHEGAFRALSPDVLLGHARLKQRTLDALESGLEPDGFNVGMNLGGSAAGGSVPEHVHTHVVPRWTGDTNFMAVTADTQVIVEGIAETHERLREAFAAQDGASVTDGAPVRF